jgi:hypothetical protein
LFLTSPGPSFSEPLKDPKRDVLRAADEAISVLDAVIPPDECIRLASPYLEMAQNQLPILLATLKLLTKVCFFASLA